MGSKNSSDTYKITVLSNKKKHKKSDWVNRKRYGETRRKGLQNNYGPMLSMLLLAFISRKSKPI